MKKMSYRCIFLKKIKDTLFAQSKSEYLSIQIYFKDFNKASFIELKFRNYGLLIFRMPILSIVCKRITVLTDVTKIITTVITFIEIR